MDFLRHLEGEIKVSLDSKPSKSISEYQKKKKKGCEGMKVRHPGTHSENNKRFDTKHTHAVWGCYRLLAKILEKDTIKDQITSPL